jgi:hypothetical protein
MNAYEFLRNDHRDLSILIEKIEHASSPELRKKLFLDLKTELYLHAFVEEKIFYPELKRATESRGIALEGYEEHRVIEKLLEEMDELSPEVEQWDAKLEVLKEIIDHHVQEQENTIFNNGNELLTQEESEQLGARMATEKAKEKATV